MSLLSRLIVCVVGVALTVASVAVTAAAAPTIPPLTWGVTGHYMTAAIAQGLLSTEATNGLTNLLPESDGQMGQVASWADQVARSKFPWSPPLHFINTPDWMCTYDRKRDCQDERGHPGVCVDQAIQNFSTQLVKNDAPLSLNVAVKFVIHFIGDIHQPLHVGFTSDLGGNTIVGTFEGKSGCKLHGIWDYNIIEKRQSSDFGNNNATYLHYFMNRLSTGDWNTQIPAWQSCPSDDPSPINACSQTWAKESIELACSHAYVDQNGNKIESGFDLEDAYYQFALPVVEMQLARGGVRLANVINAIFALPHMKKYTVDPSEFARNQKEQDKEYISLW